MRYYGSQSDLNTVLRERRNDVAEVDALREGKLSARNRTGIRTVPTSASDVTRGDIVNDFLYDIANGKKYELVNNNGTLQWVELTIVTSF